MAELVREIMIDATPETIWPFLTEPDKHVEWQGTVAEIDPRPAVITACSSPGSSSRSGEYVEVVPMREGRLHLRLGAGGQPDHARLDDGRDLAASRGRQDRACASCTAAFPTTRSSDHGDGWQHYLERLAIRAAGGAVPADTGPGAASA